MAEAQTSHGRHRRNPPKQSKAKFVIPVVTLGLLLGAGAVARGNNAPDPTPTPTVVESPTPTPTPTPTPAPVIHFATWNIAKPTSNAVPSWSKRRESISNTIAESGADILALQEASEGTVTGANGKRMSAWDDVQDLAATSDYSALDLQEDTCNSSCVHTARLLYKKSSMHQYTTTNGAPSAGHGELEDIVGGLSFSKHRQFSWGILESNSAPGPVLVISLHTNNSKSTKGKNERAKLGAGITKWAKAKAKAADMPDIPIVLMGDFNSWLEREPKGMVYQLQQDGWIDAYDTATTKDKLSAKAYTTSYTAGSRTGWPKKPRMSSSPTRIDHIMYLGSTLQPETYVVELHLKKDGTFNNDYRASDHMMVKSIINFNKPTQ